MTADGKETPEGFSLKRWSRVKREAARADEIPDKLPPTKATVVHANTAASDAGAPARGRPESVPAIPDTTAGTASTPDVELPPVESLTIDSDFTAFLQPKVDEALKREALKKLFGDPRFNVMDGLDVYIDDYSKPDPLAPEVARRLAQARAILDARPTRINAQGILEDVPPVEHNLPVAWGAQDGAPAEPPLAGPAALPVPVAPEVDVVSSTPAIEQVASGEAAPDGDPNDPVGPR